MARASKRRQASRLNPDRETFVVEMIAGHLVQKVRVACAQMAPRKRKRVLGKVVYALRKELDQ